MHTLPPVVNEVQCCPRVCWQWNYVDFAVVVFGFLGLLPGVGNVSAFRVVRVLRPLKTLNKMKGLRVIVLTLLGSLSQLGQAVVLILFLFTVYSIICVQVRKLACARWSHCPRTAQLDVMAARHAWWWRMAAATAATSCSAVVSSPPSVPSATMHCSRHCCAVIVALQLLRGGFRHQCFGDDGTPWAGLNYNVNDTGGNTTIYCPDVNTQSTCPDGYTCLAQGYACAGLSTNVCSGS